jgi:hypothetical protein
MNRREFLKQSLILPVVLSASAAICGPQPAGIRIVNPLEHSGTLPPIPLPAGQTVTRNYTLFNDMPANARLQVKLQPRLRPGPDQVRLLPAITRTMAVPGHGQASLSVGVPLPAVPVNTLLELTVSVTAGGKERARRTDSFLLVPTGPGGTQAVFLDRDDRTSGNWQGAYGKQAFFLPIRTGTASFSGGVVSLDRGRTATRTTHIALDDAGPLQGGFELFSQATAVDDPRIPLGGNGLTTRDPIAFSTSAHYAPDGHTMRLQTTPIQIQVDSKDALPHRLSLYFVDYKRLGRPMNIGLYDKQGHLLASQHLDNYAKGAYLRFRFIGSLIVQIASLTKENPTLSGAFVDPDSGTGPLYRFQVTNL